jgi:hypothetical protein
MSSEKSKKLLLAIGVSVLMSGCSYSGPPPQIFEGPSDTITITIERGKDNMGSCIAKGGTWIIGDNDKYLNAIVGCIEPEKKSSSNLFEIGSNLQGPRVEALTVAEAFFIHNKKHRRNTNENTERMQTNRTSFRSIRPSSQRAPKAVLPQMREG